MELDQVCNVLGDNARILNPGLCIVCQRDQTAKFITQNPKKTSFENLLAKLKNRVEDYKEKRYLQTYELLKCISSEKMVESRYFFHRECYSDVTNATLVNRVKAEFMKLSSQPSGLEHTNSENKKPRVMRSSLDSYKRELCFFCQDDKLNQPLVNLRTFNRSIMIKEAIEISNNEKLRIRFNSFCDAHAGVFNITWFAW